MHTLHKFSDIDHLLILCNLWIQIFFIHKTGGHVYAGHEWQQRKNRLFLTEKRKAAPNHTNFQLFQLFSLGFGESVLLFSSSPRTRGLNKMFYNVLWAFLCAVPKLQELCGYWEIWETAVGWELPGSLWLCLWPAVISFDGSLFLVDSGSLLWDTHTVLVVVFYLLLISSDVQQVGELERIKNLPLANDATGHFS